MSVCGVTTICLTQCNASPAHRVDQVVDCGLWNVGPLFFWICATLLQQSSDRSFGKQIINVDHKDSMDSNYNFNLYLPRAAGLLSMNTSAMTCSRIIILPCLDAFLKQF